MTEQAQPFTSQSSQSTARRLTLSYAGKRAFDLLVSGLGLIFISPIVILLAIWIKRDSPGPVFYRGLRAAWRGQGEFKILKFRTMYENSESYNGPRVTGEGDRRITPLGKWLRDTKLNELPQLWNVFRGEMSMVGPRPEDPEIAAAWPAAVRTEILSVRPGVTSPASVLYRNEENMLTGGELMDTYLNKIAPNKQRLDQLYVRYHTFWLDLDVLLWTLLVLIPRVSRNQPPETMLFRGPVASFVLRYFNWFVVDALVSFIAICASALLWRSFGPLNIGWSLVMLTAVGFALLFSACSAFFGVQRIYWSRARAEDVFDLIPPILLATGLVSLINHFVLDAHSFPLQLLALAAGLSFVGYTLVRYRNHILLSLSSRWQNRPSIALAARERILIVGGGDSGQYATWLLNSNPAFHVIGYVDDDLYKQGARIAGQPVMGRSNDLARLVAAHDIGIVVFAIHNIQANKRRELLEICAQSGAQVLLFPDFLSVLDTTIKMNGKGSRSITGPFVLSWPGVAPAQVEHWLQQLDQILKEQGSEAAQQQIEVLHAQLQHAHQREGEAQEASS